MLFLFLFKIYKALGHLKFVG